MSEQEQTMTAVDVPMSTPAVDTPVVPRPQPQTISDPRQIAAVVMARMNLINTKKDELTIAMKGLTDLTQQLVQAYAAQMQVIDNWPPASRPWKRRPASVGATAMPSRPACPARESELEGAMTLLGPSWQSFPIP